MCLYFFIILACKFALFTSKKSNKQFNITNLAYSECKYTIKTYFLIIFIALKQMNVLYFYKKLTTVFLLCFVNTFFSQSNYQFVSSKSDEECSKGTAGLQIDTIKTTDILTIDWSTGATNVFSINNLDAGNYSVHVIIKEKPDTVLITKKDTTINFKIEKIECPVVVSNHFTPNGDNYNDYLQISNIANYPKFELFIFNKWGQQVHSQKEKYTPWDGTWNGINVPDQTYYYVFYFDGGNKKKVLKGDITILR